MAMLFEPAELSDLPAMAALMNVAFRGPVSERSWSVESGFFPGDRTNEVLLRREAAEGTHLLVAKDPRTRALMACFSLRESAPQTWYLGSLAVDPALQNAGMGREALAAAEQLASRLDARTIVMTVLHVRESLIAWYERRGYTRTGESHPFPHGDDRFGTPLRNDLAFVVLQKHLA